MAVIARGGILATKQRGVIMPLAFAAIDGNRQFVYRNGSPAAFLMRP